MTQEAIHGFLVPQRDGDNHDFRIFGTIRRLQGNFNRPYQDWNQRRIENLKKFVFNELCEVISY